MSIDIGGMSLLPKHIKKSKNQTRKIKTNSGSDLSISVPPPVDDTSLAGNDFFRYVNAKWLNSVNVPPYMPSYGVSEEIERNIDSELREVVNKCIQYSKRSEDNDSNEIKKIQRSIGILAQSCLHVSNQQNSIKTLHKLLQRFNCIRDKNDVALTIGELARYKIKGLVWMYAQYENKRNTRFTYTLGVGSVGLPDISYYKKTAPGKGKTLIQYANMLHKLGSMLDVPELSSIVALESLLASAIRKSFGDDEELLSGNEIEKEYSDIPIEMLFKGFGLENWRNQKFFVDSRNWMRVLEKLFRFLPLETWRLLFSLEVILHFLPYLPPPYDDMHFYFYRKRLRGQTEKIPQKELTLKIINDYMTPFISRLYVEEIVPKGLKYSARIFVDHLINATEERLQNVTWLHPTTRELAKKKVEKMAVSVAYPDSFRKLPIPQITTENLMENLIKLGEWQTEYEILRLGEKRTEQKDWDEPVFSVNAYYYPQANEIVIPSGSLYYPFFTNNASLGWNYGGLGCILGHEITHAFDKEGKDFNPEGFEEKWWTRGDNRAYNRKTKELVELFDKQKVLGHPVSGTLTLSENIADLGGVAIALDALKHKLESMKVDPEKQREEYRQFFISYAVSWRVKEKPAKVLQGLFLDYHAPPSLRVNLVVSQFQEWYDAFNIKENAAMYISPENRIQIF